MTAEPASPNTVQSRPIAAAGGAVIAVQAVMAAFWAVIGDAGLMPWLTPGTQGLITFAITAIATVFGAYWAARRSTPTAAPALEAGTPIRVIDSAGATLGHTSMTPLPDPDA